jgi:hypothetical protein
MVVMGIEDGVLANGRAHGDSPSTAQERSQWHGGRLCPVPVVWRG